MKKKIPLILQSESVECGLAALAMLLNFYGHATSLALLRKQFPLSLSGLSIATLKTIAESFGLKCKVIRLEPEELLQLQLPVILHWDLNHYILLVKTAKNNVTLYDPAKGKIVLSWAGFSQHFSGIALECCPTRYFTQQKISKNHPWQWLKNMPESKSLLLRVSFFVLLYQIFILCLPRYIHLLIDQAATTSNFSVIMQLAIGYLVLRIFILLAKSLKQLCLYKLDVQLCLSLGEQINGQLLAAPLSFYAKRFLGDIVHRFGAIEQLRQILAGGFFEGLLSSCVMITTLLLMLMISKLLVGVSLLFGIGYAIFRFMIMPGQKAQGQAIVHDKTLEQSFFLENIRGIQAIKIFAKEQLRLKNWLQRYQQFLQTAYKVNLFKLLIDNTKEFLFGLEFLIILLIGAHEINLTVLTIGYFYTYLFFRQQFTENLNLCIDKISDIKTLYFHHERLQDFIHLDQKTQQNRPQIKNYHLQATQIAFGYSPWEPELFSAIDFHAREGESVVIVGPSGCGKTTFLKVLMGLLPPTAGHITLGGQPHPGILLGIMQDDCLLSGTIAQNIAFFDPNLNWDRIHESAQLAAVAAEIARMPLGFNTLVGDMGTVLSGGQKQRILLARAFYREPKILFLDEATSHLDMAREREINLTLKKMGLTLIMIAHRAETIQMADRIFDFPCQKF